MFEIEKSIPLPVSPRWSEIPLAELTIGDSVFISQDYIPRSKLQNYVWGVGKSLDRKFTVRQVDAGYRVWRIK